MIDLIGIQEISEQLGVTRSYARDRIVKRPDFPRPSVDLSQKCRRWSRESFEDWLRKQTRLQAR
ncbi:helix-turn-helix transcriptional regulator [Variovorax paradoxus]|nr:helix-turn-helix domain-containing protein [Variovorax paradoxus]